MDNLWEENFGSEVMFTWAQYLKEETFGLLNLTDSLMVSSVNHNRTRKLSEKIALTKGSERLDGNGVLNDVLNSKVNREATSFIDPRTIQDIGPTTNLLHVLREYDEEMKKIVFDKKFFDCKVCFSERTGSNCIEFWPCRHVYCKDCMKSYFEIQIKEGNIKFLKCPEDKCNSEANPKQVGKFCPILHHLCESKQ